MAEQTFRVTKDANAVLDYTLDWSQWLATGDDLATSTWTTTTGLVKDSDVLDADNTTTVWLSGGTAGQTYVATNRITTTGGRTEDRSITVFVTER